MSDFSERSCPVVCSDLNLLEEVLDEAESGKIVFSKNGVFVKANTVALACIHPLDESDLKSITAKEFFNYLYDSAEDADESTRNVILEQYKADKNVEFLEVIVSHDKGFQLVEVKTLPSGATLFNFIDIDHTRRREENLIRLNRFNKELLQAIEVVTTGIVIINPRNGQRPISFVNDAFCDFIGTSKLHLMQSGWWAFLSLLGSEENAQAVKSAVDSQDDVEIALCLSRDDQKFYYSFKVSPVLEDGQNHVLFIGVLTDLTLLKQREAEFFHAQKLESLGQLSAGVAHDFNNILSIIGGYSVMAKNLSKNPSEGKAIRDFLDKITAASERGSALTRKMLTFSRHKVVSNSVIDVCDVLKEQRELLVPLMGVNINLSVSLSDCDSLDQGLYIRGSADSLGQIVMNLAVNARDAMLNGGDLLVSVLGVCAADLPDHVKNIVGDCDCVLIRVDDNGMGMDDKTLERIFDPFFTTKDQGKGTGLGLSVVYGLVNEMGGFLDVSSVLYEGTSMFCYIPRCFDDLPRRIQGDETDISKICLDGFTALVAEDEPDLLVLVTNMLEEMGLRVLKAENGNQALELADEYENEIDILLTDVVMPQMNGVKLAELVSALIPDVKVVFMSGYPATGEMAPVELPDDIEFIAKPLDYQKLAVILFRKLKETGMSDVVDNALQWTGVHNQNSGES